MNHVDFDLQSAVAKVSEAIDSGIIDMYERMETLESNENGVQQRKLTLQVEHCAQTFDSAQFIQLIENICIVKAGEYTKEQCLENNILLEVALKKSFLDNDFATRLVHLKDRLNAWMALNKFSPQNSTPFVFECRVILRR